MEYPGPVRTDRQTTCDTEASGPLERPLIAQARVVDGHLAALEETLACLVQDLTLTGLDEAGHSPGGSFHLLQTSDAMAGYLSFTQPTRAEGWHRDWFGLAMPLSGRVRVEQYPLGHATVNGPVFVRPSSEQHWQFSRGCELLIFRFRPPQGSAGRLQTLFSAGGKGADPALAEQVKAFMQRMPTRLHLGLPEYERRERLEVLRAELLSLFGIEAGAMEKEPPGQWPLDRRVERVARRLRSVSPSGFDLDELSELAHMSQRGLYYAFNRNLGCSPYQYFKACQLVRVRNALLRDPERKHAIAWHAAREGFQHMSRFSAHYRRHFGEKPSDTLARLAQEGASQLLR